MTSRALGRSGISVNGPLIFGGNVFGWTADESRSFELLNAFADAGLNAIDTADIYSRWVPGHEGGESETLIGKWLKARRNRDKMVILTKVGMEMGPGKKGLKRDYILQSVEGSLRRLGTDYIDLYQSHEEDPQTPIDETLGAYEQLIKAGKVRAIGASNYSPDGLEAALNKQPRYESLQPLYNLYDRQPFEEKLEAICLRHQIGVIPYFSLAKGFLAGKYRSEADLGKSVRGGGVKKYLDDRGMRILAALDEVVGQVGAHPGQVALAWLMQRPGITAPIASATSMEQLHELVGSTKLKLSAEMVSRLDQASRWKTSV